MTSNAFDVFIIPMVSFLGVVLLTIAGVKALAFGAGRLAGPRHRPF